MCLVPLRASARPRLGTFRVACGPPASLLLIFVAGLVSCGGGTSLQVSSAGVPPHSVQLSWSASTSPNVAAYNIYRGTSSAGPFEKITPAPVSDTTYSDTTVVAGGTYYYAVTSVDSSGQESAYSNVAEVEVPQ